MLKIGSNGVSESLADIVQGDGQLVLRHRLLV